MVFVLALLIGVIAGLRAFLPLATVSWAAYLAWLPLADSLLAFLGYRWTPWVLTALSKPPANGRWNGLFAWDEGCGGKHARKIEADGGRGGTGRVARPIEIGAARRSGPGAGDPVDAGGAEGGGNRCGPRGTHQHGA